MRQRTFIIFGTLMTGIICLGVLGYSMQQVLYTAKLDHRPLTAGIIGSLENMQPATINSGTERMVGSALYEGLTGYNFATGSLEPRLAKSWEFADENTTLVFTLREDVLFHNGEKLTPQIVKKCWETNLMLNENYRHYALLQDIIGCEDFFNGKNSQISGIEAKGNQLLLRFQKPNTAFPAILTSSLFWVNYPAAENEVPPGTGAYQLQERTSENIHLIPFKQYHQGIPKLESVMINSYPEPEAAWQAYLDGKIDYLDQLPAEAIAEVLADPQRQGLLRQQPVMEYYTYEFQLNRTPYFGNHDLRRGLNYAIDRDKLVQNLLGYEFIVTKGVVPKGIKGHRPEQLGYQYNPDLAKQLLDQAGFADRNKLDTLYITYNEGVGHRTIASELIRQLQAVGVKVRPVEVNWNYYRKQLPRMEYSFFRVGWAADYADADDFLFSLYHSKNSGITNYNGYYNPQVDQLLEASRQETNQDQRLLLLQKAEDLILDDAPHLWLFQRQVNKIISPSLRNFAVNPMEELDWKALVLFKDE